MVQHAWRSGKLRPFRHFDFSDVSYLHSYLCPLPQSRGGAASARYGGGGGGGRGDSAPPHCEGTLLAHQLCALPILRKVYAPCHFFHRVLVSARLAVIILFRETRRSLDLNTQHGLSPGQVVPVPKKGRFNITPHAFRSIRDSPRGLPSTIFRLLQTAGYTTCSTDGTRNVDDEMI